MSTLQIIEHLLLGPAPHKFHFTTTHGYLAEGPCNMGESQHEPAVEIGKAQEALKISECGWAGQSRMTWILAVSTCTP
jgi:hypothetical protein